MSNADGAMYRAKDLGRNNYQLWTSGMNSRALERMALEGRPAPRPGARRVRPALPAHRGPRAPARSWAWRRSCAGSIPSAAWSGPTPSSRWPRTAGSSSRSASGCSAKPAVSSGAGTTRGSPRLRIAVNLSARQFQQQDLAKTVEAALVEPDLPPHSLELEITESVAMQSVEWTAERAPRPRSAWACASPSTTSGPASPRSAT